MLALLSLDTDETSEVEFANNVILIILVPSELNKTKMCQHWPLLHGRVESCATVIKCS